MRSSAIIGFFCAALASAEVKMCPLPPADAKAAAPVAAQMITGNPPGAMYSADLKTGGATGSVTLSSADMGVKIDIKLKLPKEGFPFMYHIHAKPVPADGNCTGTAAHFDPYAISADCMCDKAKKEFCQIGDVSGKAGNVTAGGEFKSTYTDMFTSLTPGNKAFVGDKSIVIHTLDNKRIACANFTQMKM